MDLLNFPRTPSSPWTRHWTRMASCVWPPLVEETTRQVIRRSQKGLPRELLRGGHARICTRRSTPPRWTTGSGPAHSPDGKGESVLSDFKVVMITLVTADCASGCECVLCEILVFRNAPYSSTKLPMWLPRWPSSRIPVGRSCVAGA